MSRNTQLSLNNTNVDWPGIWSTSHLAKNITQTAGVTNIVLKNVFKLILNQATMRKNKSLYDSDLIKFDSISGGNKLHVEDRCFKFLSRKSEV